MFFIVSILETRFLFERAIPDFFFLYFSLFNTVDNEQLNKNLPMTGFELQTSGVGSNRSTNWAKISAQKRVSSFIQQHFRDKPT